MLSLLSSYKTTTLTYDICAFCYDSLICNSHVDDIDAHVDDIIYVKYYRFVSITTHPYN